VLFDFGLAQDYLTNKVSHECLWIKYKYYLKIYTILSSIQTNSDALDLHIGREYAAKRYCKNYMLRRVPVAAAGDRCAGPILCRPLDSQRCPVNNVVEQSPARVPSMGDLPPPNTRRWGIRRKAAVVAAVRARKITVEEALRGYQLTEEEFLSWQLRSRATVFLVCAQPAFSNTVNRAGRGARGGTAEQSLLNF
jgi:hypothetical protein